MNTNTRKNKSAYYKFALDFQKIPKQIREFTFLEIAKSSHRENLVSNILQFYFDTNNKHGLENLLINSLFEIDEVRKLFENNKSTGVIAETEVRTKDNGRIDLFLETDNYCICVENKIYHTLENNLKDYFETTKSICKKKDKKPILIVW